MVLVAALLIAAMSLYWTYEHLGLKMSRLDLINPNSSFNQLWLDYIDEFGDFNEVIIVVEGTENGEVIPVLELLAEKIKEFYMESIFPPFTGKDSTLFPLKICKRSSSTLPGRSTRRLPLPFRWTTLPTF